MKRICIKQAVLFTVAAVVISSCSVKKKRTSPSQFEDHHTAQISLDWQGRYSGYLPCADCEGIDTELTLNDDLTYTLIEVWKKNDNTSSDTLTGQFTWQGNKIRLEGIPSNRRPSTFKVEENRIRQLDMNGDEITGGLAAHYLLSKMGNARVEDKRWQIVALRGKPIDGAPETHYIIFHSKEGRLEAKINCNVILSDYRITNQLQLKISQGISTRMACPDNLESELIKALDMADNISVREETLTLNKGRMAPLVSLQLVQ